jgi:hypothetical protein
VEDYSSWSSYFGPALLTVSVALLLFIVLVPGQVQDLPIHNEPVKQTLIALDMVNLSRPKAIRPWNACSIGTTVADHCQLWLQPQCSQPPVVPIEPIIVQPPNSVSASEPPNELNRRVSGYTPEQQLFVDRLTAVLEEHNLSLRGLRDVPPAASAAVPPAASAAVPPAASAVVPPAASAVVPPAASAAVPPAASAAALFERPSIGEMACSGALPDLRDVGTFREMYTRLEDTNLVHNPEIVRANARYAIRLDYFFRRVEFYRPDLTEKLRINNLAAA